MLAWLRPEEWELPVFVHVLGATLLVGALTTAASALLTGWRRDTDARVLTRIGLWSLVAALPSYLATRLSGTWAQSREGWSGDPAWLRIGYLVADGGAVIILAAIVLAALAIRAGGRPAAARAAGALASLALAACLVAVWAMVAKPV